MERKSVWQAGVQLPAFPHQRRDMRTDVLIIGGGLAGILTACFLQQQGVDYILVERGRICSRTTADTTAKITYQHGLIYSKILRSYGVEAAQQYLYANKAAFDKYIQLCREIDCDYERRDNYVYSVDSRRKLENELRALYQIGCKAELCEAPAIPLDTAGAVKFPDQAQFNPLKFICAVSKGLNIYENTCVREMIGNTAVTNRGVIEAKVVVAATHFPFINKHGAYFLKLYQHRSYVIALKNAEDVDGMYVDDDHTGMSFRNYGGLLLLGGGGHRTGKQGGGWSELRRFAVRTYPRAIERYYWAAQDCMSLDGIPYIGQYARSTPGFYVVSGFNKWGMTSSMVGAMLITDRILGRENAWADVFDPSRSILKPQLLLNSAEAAAGLLTISKKRCPHLGCALKYNAAEHSWDCSCHGSRFSESGELLNNPANADLPM